MLLSLCYAMVSCSAVYPAQRDIYTVRKWALAGHKGYQTAAQTPYISLIGRKKTVRKTATGGRQVKM